MGAEGVDLTGIADALLDRWHLPHGEYTLHVRKNHVKHIQGGSAGTRGTFQDRDLVYCDVPGSPCPGPHYFLV